MSDFLKYLGMDEEDEALARKLVSPADMAAQGASSMGESAGRVLSGLGAKLDARLGTTGYRLDEASPDVFRKMPDNHERSPGAPLDRRGLFEMLGHAVPNIAAVVGGNALPMAGPAMPGAVAAFPSPKQSLARMKEEAVFRDAMEAKGARPVERVPDPTKMPGSWLDPESSVAIDDAQLANFWAAREMKFSPAMTAPPLNTSEFAFAQGAGRGPGRRAVMPAGNAAAIPRQTPSDAEAAGELERYLAGLYGPKAPK